MVNSNNLPNAYKEVYIILGYMDNKNLERVPKNFINMLKSNMNNDYKFEYNMDIKLENQLLLKETKVILGYMFLHFWADEKQKETINTKFKQDIINAEEEKKKKYATENIFQNKQEKNNNQQNTNRMKVDTQIVEYKKENIFSKIINKIKNIFS